MVQCFKKCDMKIKPKSSPLWNHFEEVAPKKAKCFHCARVIAFSASSIGSLGRHLKALHPNVTISVDRLEAVYEEEVTDTTIITNPIVENKPMVETKPIIVGNKRKISLVWNHFEEPAPKHAKCLYCLRIIKFSASSIGSLSRHLRSRHPHVNINGKVDLETVENIGTIFEETEVPVKLERTLGEEKPVVRAESCFPRSKFMLTKRKISPLWNHFDEIAPKKAKCHHCERVLSLSKNSIGSLSRHLRTRHQNITILRQPLQSSNFITISPKKLSQQKLGYLDDQLLVMLATGCHDLRMVEEKEFCKFVEMLNPGYRVPSRKSLIENTLPDLYDRIFESTKYQITKATTVCVTTDNWTSVVNHKYLALTVHFIEDESAERYSFMIGCINYDETFNSVDIIQSLQEKFIEWGIDERIDAIVSDNNENILDAVQIGGWSCIRCFAHTLNTVVERSITKINDTITKVKLIVEYFHKNPASSKKLEEVEQELELESIKLEQTAFLSWHSTYDSLFKFHKIKAAIIATLEILRNDLELSEEDWAIIEKAIPILSIFYEVAREMSNEEYVIASKYIVFSKLISFQVEKLLTNSADETIIPIQELIDSLSLQMGQQFRDIEQNTLLCEATILDPRFKKNGFRKVDNFNKAAAELRLKLGQENVSYVVGVNKFDSNPQSSSQPDLKSFWEDFDEEISKLAPQNSTYVGVVEFDKYLEEPLLKRHENPLIWWKERKAVYPCLYAFMLKRLNIMGTTIPCERLYSKKGLVVNERRTRLTTKLTEMMFVGCNKEVPLPYISKGRLSVL